MKPGITPYSIFILSIVVVAFVAERLFPEHTGSHTWYSVLYFVLLMAVNQVLMMRAAKSGGKQTVRFVMASSAFRLLLHLCVILVYALIYPESAINFVIGFFILYLAFLFFEVRVMLRHTKGRQ